MRIRFPSPAMMVALLALFVLFPLVSLLARVAMDGGRLSPGAALGAARAASGLRLPYAPGESSTLIAPSSRFLKMS